MWWRLFLLLWETVGLNWLHTYWVYWVGSDLVTEQNEGEKK